MAKRIAGWQCECGKIDTSRPWNCPGCGKEVCERCFSRFMHCRECSAGATDEQLKARTLEVTGFDFDEDEKADAAAAAERTGR